MDKNEETLRLIAGDRTIFEQLFRRYSRGMFFVAMGLANDRAIAEDAVQESFVYLWSHRQQIDPSYEILYYLRKSVKNYVLNYLRHQKVHEKHEFAIIREQEFLAQADADITEQVESVRKMINTLPEGCRKIFVMSVIEGMSYADTAQILDVSVNTVKSQVKIAYRKIKESLDEDSGCSECSWLIFFILSNHMMMTS